MPYAVCLFNNMEVFLCDLSVSVVKEPQGTGDCIYEPGC